MATGAEPGAGAAGQHLRLFRDPAFSLGLVMAMTFFSGLAAFFMGLTIFLQQGFGYGPLACGLVFVAFGIGFVGCSLILVPRVPPNRAADDHAGHGAAWHHGCW